MRSETGSIFGGQSPKVSINYHEHAGQAEITNALRENLFSQSPSAIIEIIGSRGWGKTLYFVCSVLAPYLEAHPNSKVMWVAPTYQIAMTPIDDVFRGYDENTDMQYVPEFDENNRRVWEFVTSKAGPTLRWHNGSVVYFKSADAPESIVSKGFNLIVMDEAALIEEQVFTQQILGTARKKGVKIFMITSPRGKRHWTYRIFLKGQDPNEKEYISFQQPYTKNPYFNETLKKLIKDIPEWLYRQEYLAEFVEDGESVFRGLERVFVGPEISFPSPDQEWEKPLEDITVRNFEGEHRRRAEDRTFIAGLDIAKSVDYTVLTVMDLENGELVYYRRFNKEDYRRVLSIAAETCRRYNSCDLIFDATGVGAGLGDMLNNFDVTTHPFIFTNESKNEIVNRLILSVEYQEISLPNIKTMVNELGVYTYTLTRTGKISYNAPVGFHDDIVMSLALANWYRKENAGMDTVGIIDDIIKLNRGSNLRKTFLERMLEDDA